MGVIWNEEKKTFTLHTKNTTYQMQADQYGYLFQARGRETIEALSLR